ncbi:MAG: Fic family protein [Bdellovibrionales bacterium]
MKPPYSITNDILILVSSVSKSLGNIEGVFFQTPEPKLRKQNKIKTIHATLEIEGNTLTLEQVTAILEGKRVLGPKQEIIEVQNVNKLYDFIESFNWGRVDDFLHAHKVLMDLLIESAGQFRHKNVGVLKASKVSHIAPKPNLVSELIHNLFNWIEKDETHALIKSCVCHYEIEFIHPFEDGNGRMGRFWQTLILQDFNPIFRYIPVESLIKDNQKTYYSVLEKCDKAGDSTAFVEFMLSLIDESLKNYLAEHTNVSLIGRDRLNLAKDHFQDHEFSRKDYLALFKNLSSATASRDLKNGLETKLLKKKGNANQTKYRFQSKIRYTDS